MARRTRRKNPTRIQWTMIGVGALVVGAGTYVAAQTIKDRRRTKLLSKLPRPPEGSIGPVEPPEPVDLCGPDYPGFVFDGEGCIPGADTPGGIYVGEGCSDFVFVAGDVGPQLDYLEGLVLRGVTKSSSPAALSVDPAMGAIGFFEEFWGDCAWPPPPDGPSRIVHLYQALVYVIGREIVAEGGRVLGTTDLDLVDEQIATRLIELGYPDFDPDIVPEIELPDASQVQQAQLSVKP